MMKKVFLFIIAGMLITPVWAKRHKHKKHSGASSQVRSITITHTGCYGRCPCYSIKVEPDGTITYTGIKFVSDTGVYVKTTERSVTKSILDEVTCYRLDTCNRLYSSRATDLPGARYTVEFADSTKMIMVSGNGGPGFLKKIAGEIEPLGKRTDTIGWSKK